MPTSLGGVKETTQSADLLHVTRRAANAVQIVKIEGVVISPKKCAGPISWKSRDPFAKSLFTNILRVSRLDARICGDQGVSLRANFNECNKLSRSYIKNIADISPFSALWPPARGLCVE